MTLQVEARVEGIVLLASTCNVIHVMWTLPPIFCVGFKDHCAQEGEPGNEAKVSYGLVHCPRAAPRKKGVSLKWFCSNQTMAAIVEWLRHFITKLLTATSIPRFFWGCKEQIDEAETLMLSASRKSEAILGRLQLDT